MMMNVHKLLFLSFLFLIVACTSAKKQDEDQLKKRVETINIEGLQHLMAEKDHDIHVINFWATWCAPCVKEMPQFLELAKQHPEVSLSLVTLDFIENLETKVIPFLDKKGVTSRVLLIDEIDYNLWIDLVDPSWSGAIPATLIIEPSTGKRIFLEKEFEIDELEADYQKFINTQIL